jgi:hypothetical protein
MSYDTLYHKAKSNHTLTHTRLLTHVLCAYRRRVHCIEQQTNKQTNSTQPQTHCLLVTQPQPQPQPPLRDTAILPTITTSNTIHCTHHRYAAKNLRNASSFHIRLVQPLVEVDGVFARDSCALGVGCTLCHDG